jgi:hypothetical protein
MLTYHELVRSRLVDIRIWESVSKWWFPYTFLSLYHGGSYLSLLFPFGLYLRSTFEDRTFRFSMTIALLGMSIYEASPWFVIIVFTEILRFILWYLPMLGRGRFVDDVLTEPRCQAVFRTVYRMVQKGPASLPQALAMAKIFFENPEAGRYTDEELAHAQALVRNLDQGLLSRPADIWTIFLREGEQTIVVFLTSRPRLIIDNIGIETGLGQECSVCREHIFSTWISLPCGGETKHAFCIECFAKWFSSHDHCPLCRFTPG